MTDSNAGDPSKINRRKTCRFLKNLKSKKSRYIITSGGGGGIMEAANRGAKEAGGKSMGLGISLPLEQTNNKWITKGLNFVFHYLIF